MMIQQNKQVETPDIYLQVPQSDILKDMALILDSRL
jgi:hypothetical protein